MKNQTSSPAQGDLQSALLQMQSALQILDACDAPADIGAHVDLAIHKLENVIRESVSQDLES